GRKLEALEPLPVAGAVALRDVALGPHGVVYAVDEADGRLHAIPATGTARSVPAGEGAFRVAAFGSRLVVDALLAHTLSVFDLDASGMPVAPAATVIRHDGPIWGFDALTAPDGEIVVAAGGIEDHALDRTGGSFGFIDSFVFVYLIDNDKHAKRVAEINV